MHTRTPSCPFMPRKPAQPKNESPAELPPRTDVVVYENGADVRVEVTTDGETIWMTKALLAELFQVDRSVVAKHVRNIYATGELDERSTCAKIAQVRMEGARRVVREVLMPAPRGRGERRRPTRRGHPTSAAQPPLRPRSGHLTT